MRYTRAAVGDKASSQAVDMAMACGMTRKQAVLRVDFASCHTAIGVGDRFDVRPDGHRCNGG